MYRGDALYQFYKNYPKAVCTMSRQSALFGNPNHLKAVCTVSRHSTLLLGRYYAVYGITQSACFFSFLFVCKR